MVPRPGLEPEPGIETGLEVARARENGTETWLVVARARVYEGIVMVDEGKVPWG